MPWKDCPVKQRMEFLTRWERGEKPTDLCKEFGISRNAAYELRDRFKRNGLDGLKNASSAPHTIPHRTPEEIVEILVDARNAHPSWGPRKLRKILENDSKYEGVRLPSPSTIGDVLKREGLVKARRRRPPVATSNHALTVATKPNEVWCADFKGQFALGDGRLCYPLTITDLFSRLLISCFALESTATAGAFFVFGEAFREYGLPRVIRTDNGTPFSSTGVAGLSQLSVSWMRLGIRPERIDLGCPQQNGAHERMHRTLKQEATRPASPNTLQQQERFDRFRKEFNEVRPHEALELRTPASAYAPSEFLLPEHPDDVGYPLHDVSRPVSRCGHVRLFMRNQRFFLGTALAGQRVGLREVDEGRWLVSFMSLDLGHVDEQTRRFEPVVVGA